MHKWKTDTSDSDSKNLPGSLNLPDESPVISVSGRRAAIRIFWLGPPEHLFDLFNLMISDLIDVSSTHHQSSKQLDNK